MCEEDFFFFLCLSVELKTLQGRTVTSSQPLKQTTIITMSTAACHGCELMDSYELNQGTGSFRVIAGVCEETHPPRYHVYQALLASFQCLHFPCHV